MTAPTTTAPPVTAPSSPAPDRLVATAAVLLLVNLLVLADVPGPVRAVVALPAVVLLPGFWAMRALRLTRPRGWDALLHTVAFGLFCLLLISFAVALCGALSPVGCLVGLDVGVIALVAVALRRGFPLGPLRRPGVPPELRVLSPGSAAVGLAAVAVVLAVLGAGRLNAGGGSTVTAIAFTVGAMALLVAAWPAGRSSDVTAGAVVYLLGLAVLLATSLRGAGVTGHDIKIEMHVLQATVTAGRWEPGGMAPDYTACLSVTTLPAFLHHVLGLPLLDIFRVGNQILFAFVCVGAYLIARLLLPVAGSVAAAGLFIAFPTFVNDMPMLNRQEIALIFFTVAVLALLDERGPRRRRRTTFLVMAAGLTVSHYSSTYVAVGILLLGWVLLRLTTRRPAPRAPLLTLPLVLVVMLFSVAWSVTSGSGGGLVRTVTDTLAAVQRSNGASADAVGYSFFASRTVRTDQQVLGEYVAARSGGTDPAVLERFATTCPATVLPADTLPVTHAGRILEAAHLSPYRINVLSRQATVVLFQLGAVAGVILLFLATRAGPSARRVHAVLGGGALVLLAATVVLPQLSLNYGLLRLFQQSLILVAPLIVLALLAGLRVIGEARSRIAVAVVVTACLASTSGLLPQLIGSYQPQLNLNNSGPYYHAWYAAEGDLAVASWLRENLPAGAALSADSSLTALVRAVTRHDPQEGLAPGIVEPGGHLVLTVTGSGQVEAVAVADDRILVYRFPLQCVALGRPLLYSRDDHRVYGPTA